MVMETVSVKTSDEQLFNVTIDIACKMTLLKNLVEDIGESSQPIPLANINSKIFTKILQYFEDEESETYFHNMDRDFLFEIILAANYLDIENLLEKGCKQVADIIKDKPVEEIKQILGM